MGKPRLIILIRHAQSEGNKNRDIHQNIPDHRVKLTQEGWAQAREAGHRLRELLNPDDTVQFFTSPYTRTRETTQGILSTLTSDDPSPSPFPLRNIKVYEEPRLREQDFGNFQPCSAEMERMWQERADYGHFFYRIPNGESAADAYDRISGFNESLWRQFGEDDCASVCVLVTHGLMSRVFLMKWYHFSVEYFEDLRNVNHCEFLIMRKEQNGKYNLETKLRTWSGLKRERAQALKEKREKDLKDGKITVAEMAMGPKPGDLPPTPPALTVPKRKQWGGCPNGCDHGRFRYKKENSMHSMTTNGAVSNSPIESPPIRRQFRAHFRSSSDEDEDDPRGRLQDSTIPTTGAAVVGYDGSKETTRDGITSIQGTFDSLILSDPSNPSAPPIITASAAKPLSRQNSKKIRAPIDPDRLHLGRDFGGSASGHNSRANSHSDTETDADANPDQKSMFRQKMREKRDRELMERTGMGRARMADALGDAEGEKSDGSQQQSRVGETDVEEVECMHPHHERERELERLEKIKQQAEAEKEVLKAAGEDTDEDRKEKSVTGCIH